MIPTQTRHKSQYDVIGAAYLDAQTRFYNPRDDWARKWVRKIPVQTGNTILDLGCGDGQDVKFFREFNCEAYGVDESSYMISRAIENGVNPEAIKQSSMEDVQYKARAKSIDFVNSRFSLHYANNIGTVAHSVSQVIKKGGLWSIVVPNPDTDVPFSDTKDYRTAQRVDLRIFNDAVSISYPFHRLEEYLSPKVLRKFELQEIETFVEPSFGNSMLPTVIGLRFVSKD